MGGLAQILVEKGHQVSGARSSILSSDVWSIRGFGS